MKNCVWLKSFQNTFNYACTLLPDKILSGLGIGFEWSQNRNILNTNPLEYFTITSFCTQKWMIKKIYKES